MNHPRLHPQLHRADYLTLCGLREALKHELVQVRGTVVDYGCGSQPYRALLPPGCSYVPTDFKGAGSQIVELSPDGRLPLADGSADMVLSTQVLEHVRKPEVYLGECRRVLRVGGRLVLTTHGNWPYHPYPPVVEDYWRWTGVGLAELVSNCGFSVLRVVPSCRGRLSLVQQMLAVDDPARSSRVLWRRCARAVRALGWNSLCVVLRAIAPEWIQSGDILPVDFVLVAEREPDPRSCG